MATDLDAREIVINYEGGSLAMTVGNATLASRIPLIEDKPHRPRGPVGMLLQSLYRVGAVLHDDYYVGSPVTPPSRFSIPPIKT